MAKLVTCIAFALLVSGCAAGAPQIDRAGLAGIHTIAIVNPAGPVTFDVVEGPSVSGLAIGFRTDRMHFDSLMRDQRLTLAANLQSAVEAELRKDGYEPSIVTLPRARPLDFVGPDELKSVDADAVLDIRFIIAAYLDCSTPPGLAPNLSVSIRLVSPKTGKNLYLQGLPYGCKAQIGIQQDPSLVASDRYSFSTYEELTSKPAVAAEGFRAGVPVVAALIGRALTK